MIRGPPAPFLFKLAAKGRFEVNSVDLDSQSTALKVQKLVVEIGVDSIDLFLVSFQRFI